MENFMKFIRKTKPILFKLLIALLVIDGILWIILKLLGK